MIPSLPDVARESIADRGHVTPESKATVVGEEGGIEIEIARVSVEVVNTRKGIRRRKRRNDARVLVVDLDRVTKRTNLNQMSSLEK